jgi:uncharacterized protein
MIFVDTSAWYAAEVEDDVNHQKARDFLVQIAQGKHGVAITSDYVLDETMTLLRTRRGLLDAITFIDKIRKSKSVRIFWLNESLFDKALDVFRKRNESVFSFTDCTSFALMKDLSITEAFTFDGHFQQAGYQKLP